MMTRSELYRLQNYKPGEEWIYPNPSTEDGPEDPPK